MERFYIPLVDGIKVQVPWDIIGKKGELTEFTRMICPDGGSATCSSAKWKISSHRSIRRRFGCSVSTRCKWQTWEPTVIEHQGGSRVVDRRRDSPHPHWAGFSPDGNYALIPDLGLDQIVIYKVDTKKPAITEHGVASPFLVEVLAT